jgi:hypothetical protein
MKRLLTGLLFALTLAVPAAHAGMIATEPGSTDRERVMALVERPEVAAQLEQMGIPADQARARVAAMSEAEVASLAGTLDALPAGGALSNQDFLFIIIVILLVVLLL